MYHNNNEYVEETIDFKVGDYVRISNAKQIFEKDRH
jgi:hypothetical protein